MMSDVFRLSSIGGAAASAVPWKSLFPGGYEPDSDTALLLKLDEGEGMLAVDSSDYGNDGDIQGPLWTWGRYGNGLWYDGINDKLIVSHHPTLNLASDFCIEAWVRIEYRSTQRIIEKLNAYYLEAYKHGGGSSQIKFRGGIWTGGTLHEIETVLFYGLNTWIHVAFQRDGAGYLSLVVGGVEDVVSASAYGSPDTNGNNVTVGFGDKGYFFEGVMDEVRLSERYRSLSELAPNI